MSAEEPSTSSPRSGFDLWSLILGLAVIALTGISTFGWLETRQLANRVSRLEGGGPPLAGVGDDGTVTPGASLERQFTRLNAELGIRDAAYKGDPAASVVLVEFSDFECPFCARYFKDAYQRIHDSYVATGKVRYVFRHLPLEDRHPKAFEAAEVAECSRRQGLFWQVHDQFFLNQRNLKDANLRGVATSAGAEPDQLDQCLRGSAREQVLKDLADAREIGAGSTPTFLVGRKAEDGIVRISHSILGARSFAVFETVLEEVIGKR